MPVGTSVDRFERADALLTSADLAAFVANCAACKSNGRPFVVPPGLQVVSRISSLMSSVRGGGEPNEQTVGGWKAGTVVRLTGWALMAEVQTKVRRREVLPSDADDND